MITEEMDHFAEDLLRTAKNPSSAGDFDKVKLQVDAFKAVAGWMAIRNKIEPDEGKEGSIINGYKKEIKRNHTERNGGSGGNSEPAPSVRAKRPRPYEPGNQFKKSDNYS